METEETPAGEVASGAQVETSQAAEEDTVMEEDFRGEVMDDAPPLSPATYADSELLDQMEQADARPPATPNRVPDRMSGLQINSPRP